MNKKLIAAAAMGIMMGSLSATPAMAKTAKVKCMGVNSCKGKGKCKSANNDCKGKNTCKNQGWVMMKEAACTKKGGTVVTDAPAAPKAEEAPKS